MPLPNHLIKFAFYQEAIASVSLTHPERCVCDICLAAQGDEDAMARIIEAINK